jgi:hypothetical protein
VADGSYVGGSQPAGGVSDTVQVVPAGSAVRVFGVHLAAVHAAWTERRRVFELRALLRSVARHQDGFHVLSGDFNTEQHIHSLDKAMWAMHDEPPAKAWGLGGRQVRTDPLYGDIYDHHAVVYEWANGTRCYAYCRQQPGCSSDVSDIYSGTKGQANILKFRVDGAEKWKFDGEGGNMYELEHKALFAAIRSGKPINNGVYMARSTMLAILGRMVNYTGQVLTWEQAINSKQSLAPSAYAWNAEPPTKPDESGKYPVALPGVTKFV